MALTYRDAGVDIDAGDALIKRIAPLAKRTHRKEVLSGIGGFSGLFRVPTGYTEPILVSGTDGVGTKLKTAFATGRHDTVGIDLVAMSVNDVLVIGAEPLFFLDYFACGKLNVDVAEKVISGIARGCEMSGCTLLGGETAELPGMYPEGEYDLAGFCVGVVEKNQIRDGSTIAAGDSVIGLPSTGLHSNGHSLARKVVLESLGLSYDSRPGELAGQSVGEALMVPTQIYAQAFTSLRKAGGEFKAAAHITGGGLIENPPRVFTDENLAFAFDPSSWKVPGIFSLIAQAGIEKHEMFRTFNMGIGMILVADPKLAPALCAALQKDQIDARVIGSLIPRKNHPVEIL